MLTNKNGSSKLIVLVSLFAGPLCANIVGETLRLSRNAPFNVCRTRYMLFVYVCIPTHACKCLFGRFKLHFTVHVSLGSFLSVGRHCNAASAVALSLYRCHVFGIDTHYRPNFDRNSSPLERNECGLMGSAQLLRLETGERRIQRWETRVASSFYFSLIRDDHQSALARIVGFKRRGAVNDRQHR